ncbi:MAG: hypothetical protein GWP19_01555 [Planctomycetia bacterium]|nr:hypothetical protein [Planctomycetia bacterium]
MNGLIITDTHILFGEWSSIKDKYILNELKYITLSKPIKEVLKSQSATRTVLKDALDKCPMEGNQVAIAIDDDLLYHDKFSSDESLTKREIWDYIQWETKQKWGELGNYYTTFAEIDSPNPNVLHSITCPSFLITEIKAIVTNLGGKPIWAGPVSTIYLENGQYRNAVYMTDDDSFIKFFYRGRDGYSDGKLRFIAGQPNVTKGIGNKEELANLFNSPSDARDFVTIDLISDTKNTYLRQYRHKRIIPFEGIEVKVDDVPEDISFKSLNALSILIRDFTFENLVDFFNPSQIQDRKYEGLGKLSFKENGNSIEVADKTRATKQSVKKKTQPKKEKEKRKNRILLPFLIIILLSLLGYYLFYTESGKDFLSDVTKKIGLAKPNDKSAGLIFFDQQFNQSAAILKTYSTLTSIIPPDSIISFKLIDGSGSIEFIGEDSLDIPNFEPTSYSIEPINCCGGIKQQVDFNIEPVSEIRSDVWMNYSDIIVQLQSSFGINKLRQLDPISENNTKYIPIIFQIDSLSQINKTMQYLEFIGDNIIVRKIDIINDPPAKNYSGTFYISVFEPI